MIVFGVRKLEEMDLHSVQLRFELVSVVVLVMVVRIIWDKVCQSLFLALLMPLKLCVVDWLGLVFVHGRFVDRLFGGLKRRDTVCLLNLRCAFLM